MIVDKFLTILLIFGYLWGLTGTVLHSLIEEEEGFSVELWAVAWPGALVVVGLRRCWELVTKYAKKE